MKALYLSRECRKSGISDKHWFCNVFKNPNNVTKSIEVYSLEVCLSPIIWRGDIYPCTQHTDTIQIPSQMSRKRLGLCEETILYGQKVHRLFGRTSFTSTTVWGKVKALGIWSIWITERLFNNDEANYILWVFVPALAYMGQIRKDEEKPTQSSLWAWSCQSCWVSSLVSIWSSLQQNSLSGYHGTQDLFKWIPCEVYQDRRQNYLALDMILS